MEADMLGRRERWQEDLFVAAPLRDLIPDDHILKRVERVLDLSWLRAEVRDLYCQSNGRPGVDPEAAVRLMLAGLFHGIVHDRKLLREAQVNIAIRWFAGYRLTEKLPDHSSLTHIRQRWGEERFKHIFRRSVQQCAEAGLVDGQTVHIDATLIRADVSWQSLTERHLEAVLAENEPPGDDHEGHGGGDDRREEEKASPPRRSRGRPRTRPAKVKKYSPTDPEATMATSSRDQRMEPCYKQHAAVDDRCGVIVDVHVTTGEASEGKQLQAQLDRIEANTQTAVRRATADAAYAHARNYGALEERGIEAVIPPQREARRRGRIPARRFKYDDHRKVVRCPAGKILRPSSRPDDHSTLYRTRACDCRNCPLRRRCMSPTMQVRVIRIADDHPALLRARRRHARGEITDREMYQRHRWRAEGVHGEAKSQHGLRRAARRGLVNVAVQAYLTAAVMNLKRLAAFACAFIRPLVRCVAGASTKRRPIGPRFTRFKTHAPRAA
jgi:transposase